jgi:hypothetical protein
MPCVAGTKIACIDCKINLIWGKIGVSGSPLNAVYKRLQDYCTCPAFT